MYTSELYRLSHNASSDAKHYIGDTGDEIPIIQVTKAPASKTKTFQRSTQTTCLYKKENQISTPEMLFIIYCFVLEGYYISPTLLLK